MHTTLSASFATSVASEATFASSESTTITTSESSTVTTMVPSMSTMATTLATSEWNSATSTSPGLGKAIIFFSVSDKFRRIIVLIPIYNRNGGFQNFISCLSRGGRTRCSEFRVQIRDGGETNFFIISPVNGGVVRLKIRKLVRSFKPLRNNSYIANRRRRCYWCFQSMSIESFLVTGSISLFNPNTIKGWCLDLALLNEA